MYGRSSNLGNLRPGDSVSLGIGMSGENVRHQCPAANSMFGEIIC
jgi:hypothetical protein